MRSHMFNASVRRNHAAMEKAKKRFGKTILFTNRETLSAVEILKLYNDRYIVGDVLKITKSDLFIKMDPRFIDRQQDPSTCANLHDSIALGEAESYTCHSEWLRQRHREFHVRTKRSTVVGAVILSRNEKPASATLHPNGKPICAAQPTRP